MSFGIVAVIGTPSPTLASEKFIPLITQKSILRQIAAGKRVVFVDSRESSEYFEERIPGAHNLTLRSVSAVSANEFTDKDIVIAYCLKDFRGFEVAKALKKVGVNHVYTMAAPGLNAWKKSKLPIDIPGTTDKGLALKKLEQCANSVKSCKGRADGA